MVIICRLTANGLSIPCMHLANMVRCQGGYAAGARIKPAGDFVARMKALSVSIDAIGNVTGVYHGEETLPMVMMVISIPSPPVGYTMATTALWPAGDCHPPGCRDPPTTVGGNLLY
ncbi:hypothetical protein BANRA_00005 [Klebsiella pneumoniae]|nr:hypothetical protein BANRA_00005 [Klebsiella pneumoniae]